MHYDYDCNQILIIIMINYKIKFPILEPFSFSLLISLSKFSSRICLVCKQ